ncbi:hypothetical protein C8R46DRAFT_921578 [Mycena filopes]|nr:hypothetical protein C8R46DRAFT_921578 [Mycena filopes]
MIGQEPTDTTAVAASTSTVAPNDLGSGVYSALADIERVTGIPPSLTRRRRVAHPVVSASPEFVSLGDQFPDDFDENEQTSPVFSSLGDDFDTPAWSPYDDFFTSPLTDNYGTPLDTPLLATPTMHDVNDYINSPVIAGDDDFGDSTMELFGGAGDGPLSSEPTAKLPTQQLWTISPTTPALDSIEPTTTVFPKATPVIPPPPAFTSAGARRNVTGTRKNLKPEALIPLDAPTQKRNYITPSATSRKAVPDAFAKKRLHSVAFDAADHDEEELPALSPTASEAEKIEHKIEQKRRQNTLSARKSRKRKLEHQQMLEEQVGALQGEVTVWRERALMAQEMLRGAGVDFSFDNQA